MRITSFLLLLTLFPLISHTQSNWKFEHITSNDGLSTGTVNCVFKDSRGFVWIGTVDGLNRYDGYEITVFKNVKDDSQSISGNIITAITEDKSGTLWIGTRNNGINLFDWKNEKFSRLETTKPFPPGSIRALIAKDSKVLVGILGGGVAVYDLEGQDIQLLNTGRGSISDDNIFSIIHHSGSRYWVGSQSGSIDLLDITTGKSEQYTYAEENDFGNRKPLLQDKDGTLWIGTDGNGLIRMNTKNGSFKRYTTEGSGLSSNIITSLFKGKDGFLYIGTDGAGINVLDLTDDQFSYIRSSLLDNQSLSSDAIYHIYEDNSGVIWISTFRGGINTYSPYRTKFRHYKQIPFEENSLSFNSVIEVMESKDGYIWIGTDGGGLDRLDPKTGEFIHYKNNPRTNSISTNVAISMLEDNTGYIWIGTYAGGVNRLNRQTGQFKVFMPNPNNPGSINSRNVWSIIQDTYGDIWFGLLDGGLDKYDPITETFKHHVADGRKGSLSSNLIFSLFEDSKGNFWVGTEDAGLNLMNRKTGKFTVFKHKDGDSTTLLNNTIRTLFEDSKGQLWIGTSEGINILNPTTKEITIASVNELLHSLVINGILEDSQKNLWIATNKGISKYNPKAHSIQNFTIADGLQGNEFNYNASIKASDGTMYFGGIKGLNAFHPSEVRISQFNPKIAITSIKLFDKPVSEITKNNGEPLTDVSVQFIEELNFKYDQNVLEIAFASLDFTSPLSNKYRYKLEGFNEDWIYTDASKRTASYTNLDPDTYTFRVQGTNSDGAWSQFEDSFVINILPPWWSTWWFRSLSIITIMSVAFFFFRWRILSARRQKEELQRRIEEATTQVKLQNASLQNEKENLTAAVEETNSVINQAVDSGDFSARINLENKAGQWKELGESINKLFESILIPFNAINEIINAMATSDLSQRYQEEAKGDVKSVTDNLNYAIDNLSELLKSIGEYARKIDIASEEMLITSVEMKTGTEEIATSTSEMSTGAQQQVGRIDEASNILESIMEASSNVSREAKSINEAAEKGVDISDEGKSQMNNMNSNMQKMIATSEETTHAISTLSEKSNKISSILGSIKEIASETNMLALNAAIEAAKAGEAGGGFAVVADQIRKLAENSNNFVVEIESIIDDVKSSINTTQQSILEMGKDINQSTVASKEATNSFDALAHSYSQTLEISNQIVNHANSQHQKLKEVVQLMESVVVISEEAAAGTEQIATSSNELSSGMNQYSEKTRQVSQIIDKLNERMSQFKLNGEDHNAH